MAFNNGFPVGYPQMVYQPQYQAPQIQPQQQPAQTSGIIWVQGEAGMKAYLVAPNTTVQLWDSEAQVIYLKSADASGMPSVKVLDYTVRDNTPSVPPVAAKENWATKDDISQLAGQIKAIEAKLKEAARNE